MKLKKRIAAMCVTAMMMSTMAISASAADSEKNFTTNNNYQYNADFVYSEAYGKSVKANYNGTDRVPYINATYALKATKTTNILRVDNTGSSETLKVRLRSGYYDESDEVFHEQRDSTSTISGSKFGYTTSRNCTEDHKYKYQAWINFTNDADPMSNKYLAVTAKQY